MLARLLFWFLGNDLLKIMECLLKLSHIHQCHSDFLIIPRQSNVTESF